MVCRYRCWNWGHDKFYTLHLKKIACEFRTTQFSFFSRKYWKTTLPTGHSLLVDCQTDRLVPLKHVKCVTIKWIILLLLFFVSENKIIFVLKRGRQYLDNVLIYNAFDEYWNHNGMCAIILRFSGSCFAQQEAVISEPCGEHTMSSSSSCSFTFSWRDCSVRFST